MLLYTFFQLNKSYIKYLRKEQIFKLEKTRENTRLSFLKSRNKRAEINAENVDLMTYRFQF